MAVTSNKPTGGSGPDLKGLTSSRQGALGLAVVCAVIAGAILIFAMSRYRQSVKSSVAATSVLVAKSLIQKGTSGDAIATQGLAVPDSVLRKQVTSGALADAGVLHGKIAQADILPGQQLTAADFAASSGITATLAPNQRAMAVSLDQSHGLVGILQNGDHVDIYGGFNVDQGSAKPRPVMRLLIPNVRVLQAASTGGGIGGGSQTGNVVLAVNDTQAGVIAFASDNGKIWLALRPGSAASTPPTFQDLGSVLLGTTPIQNAILNRIVGQIVARSQQ